MASPHLFNLESLTSAVIIGLKVVFVPDMSSLFLDQRLTVFAAAMAAPNDVVSTILGRITSMPAVIHLKKEIIIKKTFLNLLYYQ
jgi:hypothetical protein